MKNIQKPIILKIKELGNQIIELINNSELPAFFLIRIVEKVYKELQPLELQELKLAQEEYDKPKEKKEGR